MNYLEMLQSARALLLRAESIADAEGDHWSAEEIRTAIAWCRNAEILATLHQKKSDEAR